MNNDTNFSGWWLSHPSEKYESQLGWWHSQYDGKNESHVPNHQPVYIYIFIDIHQTTTQWRPHVLHQGWFLQDETLHGTWPWQGQWHGHLDLSLGHVVLRSKLMKFWRNLSIFHVFLRFRTFSWFFACFSTVWTARPRICSFLKPQHHFLWPQSALLGVHLARSCQKGHRGPWLRAFWWHGQDGAFLALNGRSGSQWFITVMAINISCNWISTGI